MENNLEQLVKKSVKVRSDLSRILVKNFPVEQDFADFLAMDVVNQAIGVEALERYNASIQGKKRAKELELEELERKRIRDYRIGMVGRTFAVGIPSILVLTFVIWASMGIYACATASPYPRVYQPLPEHARFADTDRTSWRGDQVYGLSDTNNLCLAQHMTQGRGGATAASRTCIHRNKAESLNQALQRAVESDFNGVVWNEPNGNGERWSVQRNNYRFVITGSDDEAFIEP